MIDFRDDGHMFRKSLANQSRLPFGKDEAPVQQNAIQTLAPKKKALQKSAMQKAGQKKPLQHSKKEAAKPAKRSVA